MNNELLEYLKNRFVKNNHHKYHNYCLDWIILLTDDQLKGFEKEMNNIKNNWLC